MKATLEGRALLTRRTAVAATAATMVASARARAGAQTLPAVTLAASTFDSTTAGLYAVRSGMFKAAGLDVTFVPMTPAAIPPAVIGGTIQIAGSNLLNIIEAHARNVPFTLIAPSAMFDESDFTGYAGLLVRKDSPIRSARDLNGKSLGVPALRDFNSVSVMAWIDQNGGDASSLKLVETAAPVSKAAILAGRIDATILTTPLLQAAMADGELRSIGNPYTAYGKSYLGLAWVSTTAYAGANPEVIARFGRVIHDANLYCNAHHAETVDMMAELNKIDPATVRSMTRVKFAPYLVASMIQPLIATAVKYKVIEQSFDAQELISPAALKPPR
jgi:NitT/TauT family transport system substrate-binding protein